MARPLIGAGTIGGVFSSFPPTAAAPPPTSPATGALAARAFTGGSLAAAGLTGTRLAATRRLFRAGCLLGARDLRPLSARIALCLGSPFGAARCGITAILAAWSSTLPRVARSVAPHVAISVAVSTVAMPIPVAAAAATIAIVTRIAMRRSFALGLGR